MRFSFIFAYNIRLVIIHEKKLLKHYLAGGNESWLPAEELPAFIENCNQFHENIPIKVVNNI